MSLTFVTSATSQNNNSKRANLECQFNGNNLKTVSYTKNTKIPRENFF